ncbi:MAG: hypothetical protein DWQ31_02275 [Planctomycetota bacterium]|nr:MAG: hypothetical protein DWQ31_02275 [Planctomycetota bacterium]
MFEETVWKDETMNSNDLIEQLNAQLTRLKADDALVVLDDEFEPKAGTLVKLEIDMAYWHFLPGALLELLERLPDASGSEAIKVAIEKNAPQVWHGPSPKGSRDTSP